MAMADRTKSPKTNFPSITCTQPLRTLLARALYDNQAEYPIELAFNRGDVITVLERDPKGYEGWWICSLHGQVGIAPGNRLEVLGVLNVRSQGIPGGSDSIYDDPSEWIQACNQTEVEATPTSTQELCTPVRALDAVTYCDRRSGLTDSGNYSNRSSDDISLSLQSVLGASEGRGLRQTTPDSQWDDYEELDPSLEQPKQSSSYNASPKTLQSDEHVGPYQLSKLTFGESKFEPSAESTNSKHIRFSDRSEPQTPMSERTFAPPKENTSILKSAPSWQQLLTNDVERMSLHSDDSFGSISEIELFQSGFLRNQEDLIDGLSSKPAFVRYFDPIKKRIETNARRIVSLVDPSFGVSPIPSGLSKQFARDSSLAAQICARFVNIAKELSDSGLTSKFILLHRRFEQTSPLLHRLLNEKGFSEVNRLPVDRVRLNQLLQVCTHSIASLEVTVLANSSLLFQPVPITPCTPTPHFELMSLPKNHFTHASMDLPSSPDPTPLDSAFIVPLTELYSSCNVALMTAKQVLEHANQLWSPGRNSNPCSTETGAPAEAMTAQVKVTMRNCTILIRSVAEFCALCNTEPLSPLSTPTNHQPSRSLYLDLQTRGSNLCEALKGLVIQTKEVTRYLRCSRTNRSNLIGEAIIDNPRTSEASAVGTTLPGPVLQRLIGAARTVCQSLETLRNCLPPVPIGQ